MTVSLADQLKCARRELAMRQRAYPQWVSRGRMAQAKADDETAAMAAIVATLEKLVLAERLI